MIDPVTVLSGTAVGAGLAMVVAGLLPPLPDLRQTVRRLDGRLPPHPALLPPDPPDPGSPPTWFLARWAGRARAGAVAWLSRQLADAADDAAQWWPVRALRLSRLASDLAMLGETLELLLVRKAGYAVLGTAFSPLITALLALLGTRLPWTLPTAATLASAVALSFVPDLDVRTRAARARSELRRAVCIYIDLVALERAADAGPVEALERAAGLDDAPAFTRIRDALTRAHLDGDPPWNGLHTLAERTGVNELADLADIMATSGRQGAAVYTSLRARATSLRTAITAEDAAVANGASERMVIPVALLGLIFMALIGLPALARIAFGP